MKRLLLIVLALLIAQGCSASPAPPTLAPTQVTVPSTPVIPTALSTPTIAPRPVGKTIMVTTSADSGPGSLRQALQDAMAGDTITFDPKAFPPDHPSTIRVSRALPEILQGFLTIDASNAGVVLDGSEVVESATDGLTIQSNGNIVRGLQIVLFPRDGIGLVGGAQNNIIGGDRHVGAGPLGQGNLLSGNKERGVILVETGTSFNVITGNFIGTDVTGAKSWGNGMNGLHMNGASGNQVTNNLISGNDGYGVELCCSTDTRDNSISGNWIGTDASGKAPLANQGEGVAIHDGPSHNTIGPNNIIAYNQESGIILSGDSLKNPVTQNSIHDNHAFPINLNIQNGAQNEYPAPPSILDFDLSSGTASGTACADCMVEIFSTHAADGEVYEGSVTADQAGSFSFHKDQALAGPSLTATSRSPKDITSEFSLPTSGSRRVLQMQAGNDAPRTQFEAMPANELNDNHIGQLFDKLYLLGDLQGILNTEILGLGTKYVKLTITEAEAETNSGGQKEPVAWDISEFSFRPEDEDFVSKLAEDGITVDYLLNFWDKANHPQGWQPAVSRFKNPDEIEHYLEYVRFIVRHFKGRVTSYEIWNEPDNRTRLQWIQPDDYVNLVRQTVPVIRQEDPNAKIVVGGTTHLSDPQSQAYLFDVLRSDVMPLVDVVSWHPIYGDSPAHDSAYYNAYPSIVQQIKQTAAAHGFQGSYRADEILYRSPDCTWCDPGDPLDSNITAAKYYARSVIAHLGMDLGVGVAGESSLRRESYTIVQNLCTLMAGAKPENLPIEIQSDATNARYYSFSLPNGEDLAALWIDGVAVDDDPGVSSTITIPQFAGWNATGIDVLNGLEQKLNARSENGDLVIPDFLLKDYPIIIRLSK